jgi:uncharacterized protein DUF5681
VSASALVRGRPFQPGVSGNPGGRPRSLVTLRLLARSHAAEALAELARLAVHAKSETARVSAIRELLDRAYGKPTQFLAADNDVLPENLSAAELRAELVAQFQQACPEYRLIKVIPAENKAGIRRRQTLGSGPNATLIGTAPGPKLTSPALTDDERI